ncbi:ABC-type transport auxiliary lipoprotein family protein [Edaphobacter bradus]|uniref:ABC-type transport auxiliary lipoprotein family protein n=1 Tax=Edaphobacter bradus TaxID=2259016 RepID=UPI0021E09A63|nr:ABC-type transport auxiliary lipoprotein family protein [Edaphobacter bradus]
MHRIARLVLISALALSLNGCAKSKPIHYYTVRLPVAPTLTTSAHPVSLLVGSIAGAEIYRDTPIVYRIGTNQIGAYQYSRWVEPPVELVKNKLIRVLSTSGDYQSVTGLGSNSVGQFVVRGRLYEFAEVDGANITGLVSMEFELFDRKSGKLLWTHFYSQSEPAQSKEISAVVTALDTNLDHGLKEVAAGLNQYFSANPVGKS